MTKNAHHKINFDRSADIKRRYLERIKNASTRAELSNIFDNLKNIATISNEDFEEMRQHIAVRRMTMKG